MRPGVCVRTWCLAFLVPPRLWGLLLAPVFSSLLAQKTWWPWAYWVMGLACLLFAVLSVFAVPVTVREGMQEDENDPL